MKGVLVGADAGQEWLLPFWYERYILHNDFPLCFADFGMSPKGLQFCKDKGEILQIEARIDHYIESSWEKTYGKSVNQARKAWFQKPIACAKTPFDLTLWIDLDCEILGPLHELFLFEFEEILIGDDPYGGFNSGVILFRKNTPLISLWAHQAATCRHLGDQELLMELVSQTKTPISLLPPHYNWPVSQGLNPDIVILHWMGQWGKEYLKAHGGLHGPLSVLKAAWERLS